MAKQAKRQEPRAPSSYEVLGRRIQRLMGMPAAQMARSLTIRKEGGESQADWDRLLDEMSLADGVDIEEGEEGAVTIRWQVDESAW
ncbi:DUF1654 domain-containing protein [Pseudomonas citronellolis]|uniref:DUF1654 domain-containing protein n=1 Tax=Pseudomonas citronellolis TaxID=53408 RepID=UPI0007187842|nr:DUF1654 domain-containing protein [Pseudomonas citronellolis]KRV74523.1 hypothetical protein AO742_14930 [Pseudomonas citronellolis]KRW78530.1 hypothetical protein AO738_11945 [Pseudomonas citronellolis]